MYNLQASCPGRSGSGAGKGRRACNYVSGIWISASKNRCEMLIGGDDISNDVITFGMCFSIFDYICTLSTSHWSALRLIDSSVDMEPQRNWRWNSNSRDMVASPPSFFHLTTRAPWRAYLQAIWCTKIGVISDHVPDLDHPNGMHPGYLLNKSRF